MVDVVAVGVSASRSLVCSGLVAFGGAGAFLLFDRLLRNKIGPSPDPTPLLLACCDAVDVDGIAMVTEALAGGELDVTNIVAAGNVAIVLAMLGDASSAGVLTPDESCSDNRLTNSVNKSSRRPIRCDIRCISSRESTFMSNTVAMRSRWASVLDCSRNPLSYGSDKVVRVRVSRSIDKLRSKCSR